MPLNLRIPAWAEGATIAVNGLARGAVAARPGTYARIERTWQAGDTVTLTLPLDVQMLEAESAGGPGQGTGGRTARPARLLPWSPPICPRGSSINRVLLPREAKWTVDRQADLLGGVIVLKTEALALPARATGRGAVPASGRRSPDAAADPVDSLLRLEQPPVSRHVGVAAATLKDWAAARVSSGKTEVRSYVYFSTGQQASASFAEAQPPQPIVLWEQSRSSNLPGCRA